MKSGSFGETDWIRPFFVGVIITLPLSALVTIGIIKHQHGNDATQPRVRTNAPGLGIHDGPGGRIEALRIPLSNPAGKLPDQAERLKATSWFFEDYSEDRLDAFFRTLHAPVPHLKALLDRETWNVKSNGCVVSPLPALVWSLPREVRQRIYAVLSKSPSNYPQRFPFRFPQDGFARCLGAAGLSVRNVQRLERLTYSDEPSVCFADLEAAKESLNDADFEDLVETLYQIPTYRLRLHVAPHANINALVNYWGKGGRTNLIRPMLKALSKVPNGASISIHSSCRRMRDCGSTLIPRHGPTRPAAQQDCLYTAMNFFNDPPDTNFFDKAYAERILASKYSPVNEQPTFGDVVMLLDTANKPIHACVYIVSDFVFTKNGINESQPWVFMNMHDVLLTYYGLNEPQHVIVLRRNEENGPNMVMAQLSGRQHQ
jgi:hypothetical protein